MTTTVKQIKTFDGLLAFDGVVDLTPDLEPEYGNVVLMYYILETDNYSNRLGCFSYSEMIESENLPDDFNIYTGFGSTYTKRFSNTHTGELFFGPAQRYYGDYYKLKPLYFDPENVLPVKAVLVELESDLGPIVPYGDYGLDLVYDGGSVTPNNWISTHSGYDKDRPMFAFSFSPVNPSSEIEGLTGATDVVTLPGFSTKITDTKWSYGQPPNLSSSDDAFVGYFSGVVEQSKYHTVQHIVKQNTNTVEPLVDGLAISPGNLVLISARYKNYTESLDMAGWGILSKSGPLLDDDLTAVLWWRQASHSEPTSYTVPGTPLNLHLREVNGFDNVIQLKKYAKIDGMASPLEEETLEYMANNLGYAVQLGSFPDNDAYFFSAVAFQTEQELAFSLPDVRAHKNTAFIDAGDGWDWFPDGVNSAAAIIAAGFPDAGSLSFIGSNPMNVQAAGVGAIFVNQPPSLVEVPQPKWGRNTEPSVNWLFNKIETKLNSLDDLHWELNHRVDVYLASVPSSRLVIPYSAITEYYISAGQPVVLQGRVMETRVYSSDPDDYDFSFEGVYEGEVSRSRLRLELPTDSTVILPSNLYHSGDNFENSGLYEVTLNPDESSILILKLSDT